MYQPKTFICLLQRPRFLRGVKYIMEEIITFFLGETFTCHEEILEKREI